jgi:transglutaminase superfamily protein
MTAESLRQSSWHHGMDRRAFLRSIGAFAALSASARRRARAQSPVSEPWRTFEITTHVHVQNAIGVTRVWLPTPLAVAPYQNTLGDTYHVDDGSVMMVEREGLDLLTAEWPDGVEPILTLTSRVATKNHSIDLSTPTVAPPKDFSAFSPYLRVTKAALGDARIKSAADKIAKGTGTDLERAGAIYQWILTEASKVIDDGSDPNALFVAVARAAGLPARPVYGLRLVNADASRDQQCRAEVYLVGYGWVPLDARDRHFGFWDGSWVAYNFAQDPVLPGSVRGSIPFFMRPHGETGGHRIDGLDPEAFRYSITVRQKN